jgi:DNA-binding transcriptional MerR regulator
MALNPNKNPKLYYSIKEVAEMIGVNESTLRYWETEFPNLKPKTVTSTKVRQYTEKDIEDIRVIYNLIKVRGFKIAAARKYMHENRGSVDRSSEVLETLISVREQLKDLKKRLDGIV